jgi:flagellin
MPLSVNSNVPSINVQRHGRMNNRNLAQRLERLSSGLRINRAAEYAAGLSVSEGFRSEINGMMVGNRNTERLSI